MHYACDEASCARSGEATATGRISVATVVSSRARKWVGTALEERVATDVAVD